jgi:hypothetical protein
MSELYNPPAKRAKLSHPPKLEKPADLIVAIPPPPEYDPLPHRENPRQPTIELPPSLHSNIDLYGLFILFLTEAHFETIATNTNRYAEGKGAGTTRKHAWKPTSATEIKVLVATFIYMGVVRLPVYEDYWGKTYRQFVCTSYISLNRFEDLRRYLYIADPKLQEHCQNDENDSDDEAPEKSIGWWYKLEPIASEFRSNCSKYWIPGTNLSIDKIIIRFFGRSKYTFKTLNKPITQGYRIFSLCEAGYTYYFIWSSKSESYSELIKLPNLSATESIVYQLAQSLPSGKAYVLYMDNYFTRVPLLRKLRTINIGAYGTTRKHPEFPLFLLKLKEVCSKSMA